VKKSSRYLQLTVGPYHSTKSTSTLFDEVFALIFQRFGSSSDSLRGHQAHGIGSARLRVRGRADPSLELRVAEHLRNVAPSRSDVHGRGRRHEGRARTHESSFLRPAGIARRHFLA